MRTIASARLPARICFLAAAAGLAAALAPVPALADQVATATSLQTNNGCVAGSGWNCTIFVGDTLDLLFSVTAADGSIPNGTVTIYDSTVWGATGNPIGSAQLDSNGNGYFLGQSPPAGQHFLHATYAGDASHALSTSGVLLMNVELNYDSVGLNWSTNTSQAGQAITYTIVVSGNIPGFQPSGTVNLYDQATFLASATLVPDTGQFAQASRATIVYALMSVGTHYVYANYAGDSVFEGGMSPSFPDITTTQATPAATVSSPNSTAAVGQAVTFTATLSGAVAPTGTVTFTDGGTVLGSAALSSGQASFTTSSLAVGAHSIVASYGGDANNASATSAAFGFTVVRALTTTSVTSSLSQAQDFYPVTLTATVTSAGPPATGSVTFYDRSTALGTASVGTNGQATLTVQTLGVGAHSVTATYAGDGNDQPSSSAAVTVTVLKDVTTSTLGAFPTTVSRGKTITFLVNVNSSYSPTSPTGTVAFYDGTTLIAVVTVVNGAAQLSTTTLAVGAHTITANYSGDSTQAASSSNAVTVTVTKK